MRTGLGAPARLDEGTMCSRARLGHCLYSLGYHGTTLHFLAFSTRAHLAQSTMGSGRVDPAQFQHYPRGAREVIVSSRRLDLNPMTSWLQDLNWVVLSHSWQKWGDLNVIWLVITFSTNLRLLEGSEANLMLPKVISCPGANVVAIKSITICTTPLLGTPTIEKILIVFVRLGMCIHIDLVSKLEA